jgi:hypothetical protein
MGNRRHRAGVRTEAAVRPVRTQLFSHRGRSLTTGGGIRADAKHGDRTTKRIAPHLQQEQEARRGAGSTVSTKEVESVIETDFELITGQQGARPAVDTGEVVQEHLCGAHKTTVLARAAAGHVWALEPVAFPIVVGGTPA